MSQNIQKTQNMKLQVGDGVTPTQGFTSFAGVTSWSDSGVTVGENDCTDLDSTSDEFYPTLPNEGDFTVDLNIEAGNVLHQQLLDDLRLGTVRDYRLLKNDGLTVSKEFPAFVKSFSRTGAIKSHVTASVSFKISGTPTTDIV